jgi:hypothetical protein
MSNINYWTDRFREQFKIKWLSRYPYRWHYRLASSTFIFFGCYQGKNYGKYDEAPRARSSS